MVFWEWSRWLYVWGSGLRFQGRWVHWALAYQLVYHSGILCFQKFRVRVSGVVTTSVGNIAYGAFWKQIIFSARRVFTSEAWLRQWPCATGHDLQRYTSRLHKRKYPALRFRDQCAQHAAVILANSVMSEGMTLLLNHTVVSVSAVPASKLPEFIIFFATKTKFCFIALL